MGSPLPRIDQQAAFLLHSVPYRESSLIVDLFTREHGRIAAVAKGARRPHSALRGVLLQFQPLLAGWTGRSELRTLTAAQWVQDAEQKFDLRCDYQPGEEADEVSFSRSGLSGTLAVSASNPARVACPPPPLGAASKTRPL